MSKCCPKCGAEPVLPNLKTGEWACGSLVDFHGSFRESEQCLRNQLASANAIIDKLPKTADGVPAVHGIGTTVWTWTVRAGICRPREGKVLCEFRVDFLASAHDKAITDDPRWGGFVLGSHTALIPTKDCYSTREAAAAAQAKEM